MITANSILRSIDSWRRFLWPAWNLEKQIEIYANGGPPPGLNMQDDTCEEDMVPLGFAQQFMKRYLDTLLDPLYLEPGIVKAEYSHCKDPDRKSMVEAALNLEMNGAVHSKLLATLTNAAGRATVTGRGILHRRSPNDYRLYDSRLIHPPDAGIDPLDDSFREWAFMDRITLRDLEERLKGSRDGKYGWQRKGLERLKLWIMAAASEKYPNLTERWGGFDPQSWLEYDVYHEISWEPVDVYWYFRKNGERTKEGACRGHEKVDMYCISRFGQTAHVKEQSHGDGSLGKYLEIGCDVDNALTRKAEELRRAGRSEEACLLEDNERLLFYYENRFDSVEDTLIIHVDDVRIAGEQTMAEVRGIGRQAMPKLAVEEALLSAMLDGLTFAAQPHWTIKGGVADEHRKLLERGSFRSFQPFPQSVEPMAKNNTWPGMSQAFEMVRVLDTSIAADGSSPQPVLGGSQAQFAAEAQAQMQAMQMGTTRRLTRWLTTLDKVARLIGTTMCREAKEWRESYPAYPEYERMKERLKDLHDVSWEEVEATNWSYSARRLAGVMERRQALTVGPMLMQSIGAIYPSVVPFIAKEMLRAVYGDTVVDRLLAPPDEQVEDQVSRAAMNVTISFVTSTPVPVEDSDQAIIHTQAALSFAGRKLQLLQAAGTQMPSDKAGMAAVLRYGASHAARLPQPVAENLLAQMAAVAQAGDRIPVAQPFDEGRARMALAQQKLQLDAGKEQRLAADGDRKAQNQEINTYAKMRQAAEMEKTAEAQRQAMAAQRAKTMVDTAATIQSLNGGGASGGAVGGSGSGGGNEASSGRAPAGSVNPNARRTGRPRKSGGT